MTASAPTANPRTRTYSWQDPAEVAREIGRIPGIEYLQKVVDGEISAPIQDTLDFTLDEIAEGRSVWTLRPDEYQYNPGATVHGGVIATVLDSAMAVAILSTLPAGVFWTTLELKVNFVRPITKATGPVRCESHIIHSGRQIATAEGRIVDADGRLFAHASTTCLIMPSDGGGFADRKKSGS